MAGRWCDSNRINNNYSKKNLTSLTPLAQNNGQQIIAAILRRLIDSTAGIITTPDGLPITTIDGQPLTYNQEAISLGTAKLWRIIPNTNTAIIYEAKVTTWHQ